ncbi:MAG: response regulator transcription factor [Halieaceae bacterium]|jgi:two-component system, LuxR family, response regulator FixJ|nr:response regulator transcription factor [Halieaceae bacterium]
MSSKPKIYVVDDNEDWLDSLKFLFASVGLEVVTFNSGPEFLENYDTHEPGCLILDMRMPDMSGLQLQQALAGKAKYLHTIFVSGHASVTTAVSAMKAGAVDFLEKPVDEQVLLDRVQELFVQIEEERESRSRDQLIVDSLKQLTTREKEVLDLLIEGRQTRDIADRLAVSMRTIETHRANILAKTAFSSMGELLVAVKILHKTTR